MRAINSVAVIMIVMVISFIMFIGISDAQWMVQIKQGAAQECIQNPQVKNKTKCIEERVNAMMEALKIGRPWYERIGPILYKIIQFDFGYSWVLQSDWGTRKVSDIILSRVPRTILLFGTATIITILIGVYLGLKAAIKPGSFLDKFITVTGLIGWSFASWWVGMLMIYVFSFLLSRSVGFMVFPPGHMNSVPIPKDPIAYALDVAWHMVLPVTSMVLVAYGGWALITRNLVIGIMTEDYVMTARAKGLPERKILYGHVLRNAAPPIITMVVLALAGTFGGAIITEAVFSWPGMGQLYWNAVMNMDVPIIMGLLYISTILLVAAILIADILYGIFDPRVKVGV